MSSGEPSKPVSDPIWEGIEFITITSIETVDLKVNH